MRKTNDCYLIRMETSRHSELYFRDAEGWLKISTRGSQFRATAEQVLNHLLPALAGLAPGLRTTVEYHANPVNEVFPPRARRSEAGFNKKRVRYKPARGRHRG